MIDIIRKLKELLGIARYIAGLMDNKVRFCDPGDAGVAIVTGHANPNTLGDYVQAIASTGQDQWLEELSCELDAQDIYTIVVAVGGVGSESPIAEFKFESQQADITISKSCTPIKVAKDSRVSLALKTVLGGPKTISNADMEWRK